MGFKIPASAATDEAVQKTELTSAIAAAAAVVKGTFIFTLGTLQAAGAVLTNQFTITTLPANARLLAAEVVVGTALTGVGLVSGVVTIEGGTDTAGSIIAAVNLLTTGTKAIIGSNPYVSRGSQAQKATVTLVGVNLGSLTAGSFTVNLYYSVIA